MMEQNSSDSDSNENDSWDLNLEPNVNYEEDFHHKTHDTAVNNPIEDTQSVVPKIGMKFQTHEQYYDFYNQYAREKGFSIRMGYAKKSSIGELRKRVLYCSKQGVRQTHSRGTPNKARPVTRTGCKARIQCNKEDGMWVVKKFIEEHNHDLASASEAHLLRSQRKILPEQARYLDSLRAGGCGSSQAYAILSAEHGGSQNLNLTQKDCNNYYYKRRKEIYKEGDAQVAMNYFSRMVRENPGFFYAIQVDENDQTCNLFWADAKSRIDYNFFGDVVCFDTTFRTNKYGMPCAPLVGVNNHGMSVLFGCALILDEKTESFVWVFESFLNAMSGKHPKTILTDQAQAITNAIGQVMPNTHHRLCLWHIYQNAGKHLSHVYARNKLFKKDFKKCIYNSEIEEEFMIEWELLLQKYSLSANDWLKDLYGLRQKWAPVYGREHFCAGMTTTQRSESVNSFVKGYVNSTLCINDFIAQYEKAVLDRREKENQACHNSKQTEPNLVSALPFEKQAAKMYTRQIFTTFQKRLMTISCYFDHVEDENDCSINYKVDMVVPVRHDKNRHVWFNTKENTVECSCRAFEFTGILCMHALKVLLSRRIFEIPSKYILKRWTKHAKDDFFIDDSGIIIQADCHKSSNLRYSDLVHRAITVAMKGAKNEASSRVVKHHLAACLEELNSYQNNANLDEDESIGRKEQEGADMCKIDDNPTIKDPPTKKKKIVKNGGKKESRLKNALEKPPTKVNAAKVTYVSKQSVPSTLSKHKDLAFTTTPRMDTQRLSGVQGQTKTPTHKVDSAISQEAHWFQRQSFNELMGELRYPNEGETTEEKLLPDVAHYSTTKFNIGYGSTMNENTPVVNTILKDEIYSRLSCTELLHGFLPNTGEPTLLSVKNISIPVANTSDSDDSDDSNLNNVIKAFNVDDLLHQSVENNTLTPIKLVDGNAPVKWLETRLNELNPLVQDNIESWEDVKGDGHCGFRAIAEQLGLSADDGWKEVRRSMLAEMKSYEDVYKPLFGEETFQSFESGLKCEDVIAPKEAWIKLPFMGNIVASVFHCVYIVLHPKESVTYLPWRELPDSLHNQIIVVGNIDEGTHYVKIKLTENAPFPPISYCWKHLMKHPEMKIWAHVYKNKFDEWEDKYYSSLESRKRKFKPIDYLFPLTP